MQGAAQRRQMLLRGHTKTEALYRVRAIAPSMDLVSILAAVLLIILILALIVAIVRVGVRLLLYLIVNAILGLIILGFANLLGLEVPINWITIGFSAIAGIPGAILVIILYIIGIII